MSIFLQIPLVARTSCSFPWSLLLDNPPQQTLQQKYPHMLQIIMELLRPYFWPLAPHETIPIATLTSMWHTPWNLTWSDKLAQTILGWHSVSCKGNQEHQLQETHYGTETCWGHAMLLCNGLSNTLTHDPQRTHTSYYLQPTIPLLWQPW